MAAIFNELRNVQDKWASSEIEILKDYDELFISTCNTSSLQQLIGQQLYHDISNIKESAPSLKKMIAGITFPKEKTFEENMIEIKDINSNFLEDLFFIDDKEHIVNHKLDKKIRVKCFLQAYNLIRCTAKAHLKNPSPKFNSTNPSNICIIKPKKYWIDLFQNNGIPSDSSLEIFDLLTYKYNSNFKSRDFLDCPFYKINDLYIMSPSICSLINPVKSLVSNINNHTNWDIKGKGFFFENHLHKLMKKSNINYSTYKRKKTQCELIFEIDGHVFICEAKNNSPIGTARDYDKICDYLIDTEKQLDIICKSISENIDLNIFLNIKKVKSVNRLIITSMPIGNSYKINNTYVIDELNFAGYFLRRPPGLMEIKHNNDPTHIYSLYAEHYDGPIDYNQFIRFLNSSPIASSMSNKRIHRKSIQIDEIDLVYEFYDIKVGSNLFINDNNLNGVGYFI